MKLRVNALRVSESIDVLRFKIYKWEFYNNLINH